MTDDIVARLRRNADDFLYMANYCDCLFEDTAEIPEQTQNFQHYKTAIEAADEIERLRDALMQIAATPDHYTPHMVRAHARAALAEEKNK